MTPRQEEQLINAHIAAMGAVRLTKQYIGYIPDTQRTEMLRVLEGAVDAAIAAQELVNAPEVSA